MINLYPTNLMFIFKELMISILLQIICYVDLKTIDVI
jgi:hypothetical protein